MILLVVFHGHFWELLSKRAHLKNSSENKGTSTENFGERLTPSLPPPPPPPSPQGLHISCYLVWTCLNTVKLTHCYATNLVVCKALLIMFQTFQLETKCYAFILCNLQLIFSFLCQLWAQYTSMIKVTLN